MRKVIHIDMDAFYASIEQRDDRRLRGRPIAVGGRSGRSVVATASYEARRFGVHSAMPMGRALSLCPELIVVRPRFEVYRAVSREVLAIFRRWTSLVEPLSLDEAYLDVTDPIVGTSGAVEIARRIKADIHAATGLTASAGVSFNKFLAKIASGLEKPDGLSVVRPEQAAAFIAGLPIDSFHGVGPATAARLHALGIRKGSDLQRMSEGDLVSHLGRFGHHLFEIARARDDRKIEPDRPRRSLSVEETYEQDLPPAGLGDALTILAGTLADRLARAAFSGRTIVLKIRTADFQTQTRSHTELRPIKGERLEGLARQLLFRPSLPNRPVRLLGIGIASPMPAADEQQLDLPLPPHGYSQTRS